MASGPAVIILTYNESPNIAQALQSISGWADQIFIVDSYSSDDTVAIASSFDCEVYSHRFDGYASQRNWALENLPLAAEWILFLDADEWLTEDIKGEISRIIADPHGTKGFALRRRFLWMGRWIRRGYYPVSIVRLFRRGFGRCEAREINEQIIIDGAIDTLQCDFMHEDRKGIHDWILKHNRYAYREAQELLSNSDSAGYLKPRLTGTVAERRRWFKTCAYNRLPPLWRAVALFVYRYVLRGGFLDGREALIYHVLQGFWYPFLTDAYYLEMKAAPRRRHPHPQDSADTGDGSARGTLCASGDGGRTGTSRSDNPDPSQVDGHKYA